MFGKAGIIGILGLLLLAGCTHQAPQRPSRRMSQTPVADSATLALMELNQRLAQAADEQVARVAQSQEETYALYEANAWMHIFDHGDETRGLPSKNEPLTVHLRVMNMDKQLLMDAEGTYVLGKRELPEAVEQNIGELHHGGKARLFVPWYSAYGLQGTAAIPPYENVIIDIELR